jgi:hypothetical protein
MVVVLVLVLARGFSSSEKAVLPGNGHTIPSHPTSFRSTKCNENQ